MKRSTVLAYMYSNHTNHKDCPCSGLHRCWEDIFSLVHQSVKGPICKVDLLCLMSRTMVVSSFKAYYMLKHCRSIIMAFKLPVHLHGMCPAHIRLAHVALHEM